MAPALTYSVRDVLTGAFLGDLPLTGVRWSWTLNGAGAFSGKLNVADPRVQRIDWKALTEPNRAALWVGLDDAVVWGGMVTARTRDRSTMSVSVTAQDWAGYLSRREQAKDYSTTWATVAASPLAIAETMVNDALLAVGSLPISVAVQGTVPGTYWVTSSFPGSQRQTLQSVLSMLAGMGYGVGFDYASDVTGTLDDPAAWVTLSYPRRGRIAGETGLVIEVAADSTADSWTEDGTRQATSVSEMSTGSGGVQQQSLWAPAFDAGYPLLERQLSHSSMSSTPADQSVLAATLAGDLARLAYPPLTATVTIPAFGPGIVVGDFIVGDDVRVKAGTLNDGAADPLFPDAVDTYLRIVGATVQIADAGTSTMTLSLTTPPTMTPTPPVI